MAQSVDSGYRKVLTSSNSTQYKESSESVSDNDKYIKTELFKEIESLRPGTPETHLSASINKPDITFFCDLCTEYIDSCSWPYHQTYHCALLTLHYTHPPKPIDTKSLLQRRNNILRKIITDTAKNNQTCFKELEKINIAYEILKTYLEDTQEEVWLVNQEVDNSFKTLALSCSTECVYGVGICSSQNRQWKSCMEDFPVYQDYFGDDKSKCYLAIFDGYHGPTAAHRSGKEFHQLLLNEMVKFDPKVTSTVARNFTESNIARSCYEKLRPATRDSLRVNLQQESTEIVQNIMNLCYKKYDQLMKETGDDALETEKNKKIKPPMTELIQKAFRKSYLLMDILLSYGLDEPSKVRWSGTSALTIIIQDVKSFPNKDGHNVTSLNEECLGLEREEERETNSVVAPPTVGVIHVANAGNTRALLVKDNKPCRLTKVHTADNKKERNRVLLAGGNFNKSQRNSLVNGVLSVTRGLGNHGDQKLKDCVIIDPSVTSVPIDQHAQLLILASHGIWEVFSENEVVSLLIKMLPDQLLPPPSRISKSLLPLLHSKHESSRSGSSTSSKKSQLDTPQHRPQSEQLLYSEQTKLPIRRAFSDGCTNIYSTNKEKENQNEECLSNVPESKEDRKRHELARSMAEQLTQAALLAGAKENITVIVVLLPGCGL